ncbi:hypothetical protein ACFYRC_05990 [Streptomyces sp. NPDC005279]|uniref:hypothetical protein n=1 Tax=Streptomyces sp. NPDC005279 TaxID=3364712 RepID=UPI003682D265
MRERRLPPQEGYLVPSHLRRLEMEHYRDMVAHHLEKLPGDTWGAGTKVWLRWKTDRRRWVAENAVPKKDVPWVLGPGTGVDWEWIAEEFGAPPPVPPSGEDAWMLRIRYADMPDLEDVWPMPD